MSVVFIIVLVVLGETIAAGGLVIREFFPGMWSQTVADIGMAVGAAFGLIVTLSILQNGTS